MTIEADDDEWIDVTSIDSVAFEEQINARNGLYRHRAQLLGERFDDEIDVLQYDDRPWVQGPAPK